MRGGGLDWGPRMRTSGEMASVWNSAEPVMCSVSTKADSAIAAD